MVAANTRRHARLQKKLPEYAEALGVGVSTLKFWIGRGKDRGYPCPLDEPEEFFRWWTVCMNAPVLQRFRAAAGTSFAGAPAAPGMMNGDGRGADKVGKILPPQ